MLSAWRKLTKKQDERPVFPMGVAPVDQNMQKKYAKGVQYNMKIIIKGDRNTGKSMLLQRLTGSKYKEEYIPTQEIQVANINWNYKGAGDIVKVEVWDIVDKSRKKRTPSGSLKISNDDDGDANEKENNPMDSLALDAEFIDVYKGTHGVFLTMDITKAWTWQYVQRELEKIPHFIPVLILANFRDMGDHRVVGADEIIAYIENLNRPTGSAEVYFTESSMKDGFGLHFIYKFLNMPFLMLQRETLLRQLEANTLEIEDTRETLSIDLSTEEQNYGLFKEMLAKKQNPSLYPKPEDESSSIENEDNKNEIQKTVNENSAPTVSNKPRTVEQQHQQQQQQQQVAVVQPVETESTIKSESKQLPVATVSPTVVSNDSTPTKVSKFQAYKAKLFGGSSTNEPPKEELKPEPESPGEAVPIDEFNPGQLDDSFLSDNNSNSNTKQKSDRNLKNKIDSDDDSDGGNPMVAGFEDLDSDDDVENVETVDVIPVEDDDDDDDDFDDLSDDERPDIESPRETSIMDKVRASKLQQKQQKHDAKSADVTEIVVMTEELDVDKPDYADLDSNEEITVTRQDSDSTKETHVENDLSVNVKNLGSEKTTSLVIAPINNVPAETIAAKTKTKATLSISSDDGDEQDNPYVVTTDMDVQDDWLNDKDSEEEPMDEEEEAEELDPNKSTTHQQQETSINFDLDDLEAFMSDQMSKVQPTVVETTIEQPSESSEKPKKKKKKKTTTTTEEPSTEKRKKKKTKSKQVDNEDTPPTTTKTKKSKKTDTSSDGSVKKKKSVSKKKSTPQDDLDAFFAS